MDRRRVLPAAIFLLIPLAMWEVFYDDYPKEAIAFFSAIETVEDEKNSLFTIAGLASPVGTKNIHKWGYSEVSDRRNQNLTGKGKPLNILDNQPAKDGRLFINLDGRKKHFVCWLPDSTWAEKDKNCMDEQELKGVLNLNRLLLDRYKSIFQYEHLYYELNDSVGLHHTISLSKLIVISYWLKRDQLSEEDIETIFKFYNFWENVIHGETLGLTGLAISLVNYGLASNLIANLSKINPDILYKYYSLHGEFNESKVGEDFTNSVIKNDFRFLNSGICILEAIGSDKSQCNRLENTLTFKPLRTLDYIYEIKPQFSSCEQSRRKDFDEEISPSFWMEVFKRPGNFRGRAAAKLFIGGFSKMCEVFDNLNIKAEENGLRNLLIHFKLKKYSQSDISKTYSEDKDQFKIFGTDRYYIWDEREGSFGYSALNGKLSITIPYPI